MGLLEQPLKMPLNHCPPYVTTLNNLMEKVFPGLEMSILLGPPTGAEGFQSFYGSSVALTLEAELDRAKLFLTVMKPMTGQGDPDTVWLCLKANDQLDLLNEKLDLNTPSDLIGGLSWARQVYEEYRTGGQPPPEVKPNEDLLDAVFGETVKSFYDNASAAMQPVEVVPAEPSPVKAPSKRPRKPRPGGRGILSESDMYPEQESHVVKRPFNQDDLLGSPVTFSVDVSTLTPRFQGAHIDLDELRGALRVNADTYGLYTAPDAPKPTQTPVDTDIIFADPPPKSRNPFKRLKDKLWGSEK